MSCNVPSILEGRQTNESDTEISKAYRYMCKETGVAKQSLKICSHIQNIYITSITVLSSGIKHCKKDSASHTSTDIHRTRRNKRIKDPPDNVFQTDNERKIPAKSTGGYWVARIGRNRSKAEVLEIRYVSSTQIITTDGIALFRSRFRASSRSQNTNTMYDRHGRRDCLT